jgi:prepilin-type N-terminal cleavage/methylation domain-containing protein
MIFARQGNAGGDSGFTLIEIIFAIVLLAAGLSIIIGLQSSAVTQSLRDRNKEIAIMAGRRILAQMESNEGEAGNIELTLPLVKLMERFGAVPPGGERDPELDQLADFTGQLSIKSFGIEQLNPEAMKQITLAIYWSPSPLDSVELVYFVPAVPAPGT